MPPAVPARAFPPSEVVLPRPASARSTPCAAPRRGASPTIEAARAGVTLLELLVVLVLLGLAAAAVAPALRAPRPPDADPRAATIAQARALALRRAEALRLEIDGDGRWRLLARDSVLQSGGFPGAGAALRLAISPLGVCVPETDGAAPGDGWDAGACAPVSPPPVGDPRAEGGA